MCPQIAQMLRGSYAYNVKTFTDRAEAAYLSLL
jgi:hypothetical protein